MRKNITIDTDSYKRVHWKMLPKNLDGAYEYGEPRLGGRYPEVCYFGMRFGVQDHLLDPVTDKMIEEGKRRSLTTFGTESYFNEEVWRRVQKLGYLPIVLKAVPEGTVVPAGNVNFTVEATEKWFAKSLGSIEDILMHTWYPTGVATRSMYLKREVKPYFDKTSEIGHLVLPFAVNDFGLRGATCHEAAARGGAGHLIFFEGSDNEPAQTALGDYYNCYDRLKSIWATEHFVQLSFGLEHNQEKEYLIHQLVESPPNLAVAIVIDGKDSDNFIKNVVASPEIVEIIKKRPGRVILRPDSGDPKRNILKYLDMLGGIFGYRVNNVNGGYKVVNDNVGLIQGDGMDEDSIPNLYREVTRAGWAADNFVTGSGGGLLQENLTRDTSRWAIKPSYIERDGVGINVQKNPATDPTKASKPGKLKLHNSMNSFITMSSAEKSKESFAAYTDELEVVYENGKYYKEDFKNVMTRANKQFS